MMEGCPPLEKEEEDFYGMARTWVYRQNLETTKDKGSNGCR
jgi:hypothetical protein